MHFVETTSLGRARRLQRRSSRKRSSSWRRGSGCRRRSSARRTPKRSRPKSTRGCFAGRSVTTKGADLERVLAEIARELTARARRFALVGGLAVSLRAEVRFTRDVDLAVEVRDDEDAETLVRDLGHAGFRPVATVEHEVKKRLSIARLQSPTGVVVDLLFASSGLEHEITARATSLVLGDQIAIPVARSEELLAMKILSMTPRRLQDRIDAQNLVTFALPDIEVVRADLALIDARGYGRGQDLAAKLDELLASIR